MKLVVKSGGGRGRPRQAGERDASGRLLPPGPNPKVIAARRALVGEGGDLALASDPLDLALARQWISAAQHRAGVAYAQLYKASRMGAPDRDVAAVMLEAASAERDDPRRLQDMADLEICAAFDAVFDERDLGDADARAAAAFRQWKAMNGALQPAQQREVFLVCVRQSWPQWIIQRAAGRLGTRWEVGHGLLTGGLSAIAAILRKPRQIEGRAPAVAQRGSAPVSGRRETTRYVDSEGQLLFEVERRAGG